MKKLVLMAALPLLGACGQDFSSATTRTWGGERLDMAAATWVDPDGCEHWVMDTGIEGYMALKRNRDGTPVCAGVEEDKSRAIPSSFVLSADAVFDVDSAVLKGKSRDQLTSYFSYLQQSGATRILIEGHTDSDGTEDYNLDLSARRAITVAGVAADYGLIADTIGLGESQPVADNDSVEGKQANRRVEIVVLQ